jgi:hypothetical protein
MMIRFYTKIIDIDEIYNFVVQIFFILKHLRAQIIDTNFRSNELEKFCFNGQNFSKN